MSVANTANGQCAVSHQRYGTSIGGDGKQTLTLWEGSIANLAGR